MKPRTHLEVGLLTGGLDRPYAFGLAMELVSKGVSLDVIAGDELDGPDMRTTPQLNFLNLRGDQRADAPISSKISRILLYYVRLIQYASRAEPKTFHILWNNKFQSFDRTILMLYYKLLGKKVAFTAHNVNAGIRDSTDSLFNRLTLRTQYRLADHIFVHTQKMKSELLDNFGVAERKITVIPFGINNAVPDTDLSVPQAKRRLGLSAGDRAILFFGHIGPYKGLQFLIPALKRLVARNGAYRLIIAGRPRAGSERYFEDLQRVISLEFGAQQVIQKIQHIPDVDTELYFKAADVLVLPYTEVSQSGVLFLGYRFGLPVIAADVGSLREDIIEGKTGFLCEPRDPDDLGRVIEKYFESDLFKTLDRRRQEIQDYAKARHSWGVVGEITRNVYVQLSGVNPL